MASRNKPFDQFGPYILFKKLESDALGDLWRAGRVDGTQLGPTVAVRRLLGGDRAAMTASAEAASHILPQLSGTSFVRDQSVGVIDSVPYLSWSYAGGRSLRHIIDRARGGNGAPPNPLPIEQAIVIAEKVALSLATTAELRDGSGARLSHGALVPQFIWISDDGEIRVAGQQLGAGIMASLDDQKIASDIGRYFSPESRGGPKQVKNFDVYSLGAIVFLLVTGQEPPDAATASAFVAAVRAAKTMTGAPVPDDIRIILDKSFNLDPSMRYASIGDMKQALGALAHGGKYSATTFNLAFYLSTLLKKEMETETVDRDKESKVNVAPYTEVARPAAVTAPAVAANPYETPMFGEVPQPKSKLPLLIAATVVIAGVGLGAYMMLSKKPAQAASTVTTAQLVPAPKPQPRVSEPVIAVGSDSAGTPATATNGSSDPEAQKKAFEDAVRRKMNEEMMKLQSDFMAELKQKQARNAPVAAPSPAPAQTADSAAADDRATPSASQLDQSRRDAVAQTQTSAPAPAVTQTQAAAPAPQIASTPAPAPAQTSGVREGDVVDFASLDDGARPLRPISVAYPPIARQQRISATVIVSALVNTNGQVTDVRVLRGDERYGINDAARRAMRTTRFSPPMKDGKRVQTWVPQTFDFRP